MCVSILSEIAVIGVTLAEETEAFEIVSLNKKKESYAREREASWILIIVFFSRWSRNSFPSFPVIEHPSDLATAV